MQCNRSSIDDSTIPTQQKKIARFAKNTDPQDFHYLVEELHKTTDGEYFLHGRGGANTEYKVRRNGGYTGSEEIKPLNEEEALNWCEEHSIKGEIVVEEFGHLIENVNSDDE